MNTRRKWMLKITGSIIALLFLIFAMIADRPNSTPKYIAFVLISGIFVYMIVRDYNGLKKGE